MSHRTPSVRSLLLALCAILALHTALAQKPATTTPDPNGPSQQPQSIDSVYSTSTTGQTHVRNAMPPPPSAIDPAGPAVSLETNEPLFFLAAALNTCGYDEGLAESAPVRTAIRNDIQHELELSADARAARDEMCFFIHRRDLGNEDRNVSQYLSLAVYLTNPPELTTSVADEDMPPDSTGVEGVLPYVRKFAAAIDLHLIWLQHRPEYEEIINVIHDNMTKMILETNIYLKEPASTYEGRRFLVLIEPMLSPALINARVYGSDYIVAGSPAYHPNDKQTPYTVQLTAIRHTYLHYQIEPLIYTRAGALERMVPFLKIVAAAPIDFSFRSDVVAFFTECLIKSIEARLMDTGIPKPTPPPPGSDRPLFDTYNVQLYNWEHQAEVVRRATVEKDVESGFVLTRYFYEQMLAFEKSSDGLNESIGGIVYGMPIDRELGAAKQERDKGWVNYLGADVVQHVPRQLTGLDLADLDMMKGKVDDASDIAQKVLDAKPAPEDAARANFILGRIDILNRDTSEAIQCFQQVVKLSQDPRTLAWAHIYLGRIYDVNTTQANNLRPQALAEYRAAETVRDSQLDTKTAADNGLKQPFALPKAAMRDNDDDNTPMTPEEIQKLTQQQKQNYKSDPTTK